MSCSFNLNLPTDIPWERICVTEDMLDPSACGKELPPKWHSSVAVFKYVPEDDYQQHPDYTISYLKVAATVTGYQPKDKEIEGQIDWDGLDVSILPDVEDLLSEYMPCTGAILQVTIVPDKIGDIPVDKYPFFMDFEPKKRNLYEMATDTNERASRSLESLNIGKSASTLESVEVLDIDMGSSSSFGANASYLGTGGGFTSSSSTSGQWGTKSVGANQSEVVRTMDRSQEKREAHSHTTQLSQLYHLLDSYHVGTNRAVFFIQPRPHVLEEPSGFVRGPRPIDGIQEFFLVVAQPKEQKGFCFSIRLDTAHLTEIDILDYAYKTEIASCSASAPTPVSPLDPRAVHTRQAQREVTLPLVGHIGWRNYACYRITDTQTEDYIPSWSDYKIDVTNNGGYDTLVNTGSHGSSSVSVSSSGDTLSIVCTATGNKCFNSGGTVCVDCPDSINSWSGSSSREIRVNLISREPIIKVGIDQVLMITTRGLCCCPTKPAKKTKWVLEYESVGVKHTIPVKALQERFGKRYGQDVPGPDDGPDTPGVPGTSNGKGGARTAGMSPQEANELSDNIRKEMLRHYQSKKKEAYIKTDFFLQKLDNRLRQSGAGRKVLKKCCKKDVPIKKDRWVPLQKHFGGLKIDFITKGNIARLSNNELSRIAKVKPEEAAMLRLAALGLVFKNTSEAKQSAAKKSETSKGRKWPHRKK
jgi:hypothetical protein